MIGILDFLINIEYIQFIISTVQLFKKESFTSITFLFFILISLGFFILVTSSIIKIIYYLILKKKIKCMDIIRSLIMPSTLISLKIIILTTIFTFTVMKNEKIEVIEPNENKFIIVGEKAKFKNFDRRNYISLTKEYALKKIGLDKYIDIKKTLQFDNFRLNNLIEKIDIMLEIDNSSNLSLNEKKYFKEKLTLSNDIDEIKNKIYFLINENKLTYFLELEKEILNNFKDREVEIWLR